MSNNPIIPKSLGMYNSTNPMMNGETRDEITSLLTSYFNDKSSSIQNDICDIVATKLEAILSHQHNQITSMRSNLDNLYTNYLNEFDSNEMIASIREKSTIINQDCLQLKQIITNYEQKVKELCQNSKDVDQIENVLREIDQLIKGIQSDMPVIECDIDNGLGNINSNDIQNQIMQQMNQVNNVCGQKSRMNAMPIIDKAMAGLQEAQRKINVTNKKNEGCCINNNDHGTIDVNSIKQFKKILLY